MKNKIPRFSFDTPIVRSACCLLFLYSMVGLSGQERALTYPIVDTGQATYYSDSARISKPGTGDEFYGQDAQYAGNLPQYRNNGDGTVSDGVTGLMWSKALLGKMTYAEMAVAANDSRLGGYADWRVPTIKELYSLIQFNGRVSGQHSKELFLDTDFFEQPLGDTGKGEREIDAQTIAEVLQCRFRSAVSLGPRKRCGGYL